MTRVTSFVSALSLTNRDVINTNTFSVTMSSRTVAQLTKENHCTLPLIIKDDDKL